MGETLYYTLYITRTPLRLARRQYIDVGDAVAFESIDALGFNESTMQSNHAHVRVSDQSFYGDVSLNGADAILFEMQATRYSRMSQHCKVVG